MSDPEMERLKQECLDRIEVRNRLGGLLEGFELAEKAWITQKLMIEHFCSRNNRVETRRADESDQNNEAAGRGFRFGNLPPELRFKIYDYIVPGGLWQGYKLDELLREIRSGEPVRSRRIGKIPPLLRTSKWILDEALDSVFKRHGQIHIRNRASVVSNFPLEIILKEYSNPCREVLWEDNIQLSRCEKLSITIEQPSSPRSAEQFLQTRRVVDRVVDWLNSCSDLRPSHVQVNLVFDQQPLWNDFAILTGPLSKLKRT